MNNLAPPRPRFRLAWGLGFWGIATWSVLRLHDLPFARGHSICGPWGCGPTIPALLAAHGFWFLVAIPGSLLAARWLARRWTVALGWACLGLASLGLGVVSIGERTSPPEGDGPGTTGYRIERFLFAIATNVDVPTVPVGMAGIILLSLGLRPSRRAAGPVADKTGVGEDECRGFACRVPTPRPIMRTVGRIELGKALPELTLLDQDGETLVIPAGLEGRISILYFMRAAGCSICRKHVRALVEIQDRLRDRDLRVFVVHPGADSSSRSLASTFPGSVWFSSGRASRAHDKLGVADRSFGLFRGCGTIMVDELGVVRYTRLGILPMDGFSEPELIDAIGPIVGAMAVRVPGQPA